MFIENARGFKGDNNIVKVEQVLDDKGNLIENQYNKDGYCLVTRIVKWAE